MILETDKVIYKTPCYNKQYIIYSVFGFRLLPLVLNFVSASLFFMFSVLCKKNTIYFNVTHVVFRAAYVSNSIVDAVIYLMLQL